MCHRNFRPSRSNSSLASCLARCSLKVVDFCAYFFLCCCCVGRTREESWLRLLQSRLPHYRQSPSLPPKREGSMVNRKNKKGSADDGDDTSTSSDFSNDAVVVNVAGYVVHDRKSTSISTTLPPVAQQRPDSGYPNWDKQTESQFYNMKSHRSKSARARLWNKLQHDTTQKIALSLTTPTIVEEC